MTLSNTESATLAAKAPKVARRNPLAALAPLLPFVRTYRLRIMAALGALALASAATLVVPVAVRRVIDIGFAPAHAGAINATFIGLIVVVGALALASGLRYYFVMTIGEGVVADLRKAVFAHLASLDAQFYDTAKTGELVSRLTADTTQLKATFGSSASVALRNFFLFIGSVGLMIYSSPHLSLLTLVAIVLIVVPLVVSGRGVGRRARRAQDRLADATALASENLGAVKTMQAYGEEQRTVARFGDAVREAYKAARLALQARAILTAVAIFVAFSSVIGVLWFGAHNVLTGAMTAGQLSQFLLYAVLGASSLGQLSEVWNELTAAAGAAGRLADILSVRTSITAHRPVLSLTQPRGEIVFEDVSFAYPTRPDEAALQNLSFTVSPGESVALVGPSGAGKSTVLQLLLRFYDPASGVIRLDGVNINQLEPDNLRAAFALVPQEPVIFGTTIAENIRYGSPGASMAAVKDAATRAAAAGFIEALPEGYDTLIGERGITLSGGQRQRLALARAILKDASVLLLDEATSALDAENEQLVQQALEGVMADRTTLVIAHRLATVLRAKRILVLDAGRIVEQGTHQSLVSQDGLYARLARLQFNTGASALQS